MGDQYSFLVKFERKDELPDEEYYYNEEEDARFHFNLWNTPTNSCSSIYSSISLLKVDWINRRDDELDGIVFE